MTDCLICDWFDNHIEKEDDKERLSALRLSKKIHSKSNQCPTIEEDLTSELNGKIAVGK